MSEQRFRALFEFSPDAIIATGEKGEITEVNSQVERFFAYSRDELVGQRVEILIPERFRNIHPAHRAEYNARLVRARWASGWTCTEGARMEANSQWT